MSDILRAVFASGGDRIVPAVRITNEGQDSINLTIGYSDFQAFDEGQRPILFKRSGVTIGLPSITADGTESLSFGIDNVTGQAQDFVWKAIESGTPIGIKLFTYLASNPGEPAEPPVVLQATGGSIEGPTLAFNAAYMDLLNIEYPRDLYDTQRFPALQYISRSSDL